MTTWAYGIFEGGGVRGYAHLGALKACEVKGVRFAGVAGTSIGAIVAALVAAGFDSSELYEVDKEGREKGLLAIDVVQEFLDPVEYRRLQRLRATVDRVLALYKVGRRASAAVGGHALGRMWARMTAPAFSAIRRRAARSLSFATAAVVPIYIAGVPVTLLHWRLFRALYARSGVLDSRRFTEWLNDRLAEHLRSHAGKHIPTGAIVTFSDLPIPLACIATNLSKGTMEVFDRARTPGMGVAEAAMASASYPLVFKPCMIDGDAFVDGGLLSNFPAWTLDDVRASQDRIMPTFGFRVIGAEGTLAKPWPGASEPRLIDVSRRIVSTAMWGRGDLESRRIEDLHPMHVETPIKAMDFHRIRHERINLYRSGRKRVADYFASQLGPRDPDEMEERLRKLCDVVRDVAHASGVVRAYLIQPTDEQFARVVYSAFYEMDADDRLTFRLGSASQTVCLERREPILMRIEDLDEAARRAPATKLVHALRPTAVTHVYCIPMFAVSDEWSKTDPGSRARPLAALCVDFQTADDRLLLEPEIEDALAAVGDALVDLWLDRDGPGLSKLPEEDDQPPSDDWQSVGLPGFYVSRRKTRKRPAVDLQDRIARVTI